MKIEEFTGKWRFAPSKRYSTKYIILHHAAVSVASESDIHIAHLKNPSWAGFGYHFYVRKDGTVYEGRPIDTIGAQCQTCNSTSIGICFEGNFENEVMTDKQFNAGVDILTYCRAKYPKAIIKKHKDLMSTACPGKNFPFAEMVSGKKRGSFKELTDINDIVWEYAHRGIITDSDYWIKKFNDDTNPYWFARKALNYIRKIEEGGV